MNKPSGYDEATTSSGFTPANLGGHYCVIKQVTEKQSSKGQDMIVVLLDFCKPDEQADYFSNLFNEDDREDKKWPFAGSKYIMVYDFNNPSKTSRQFKTFCTCVEKSNKYTIKWGGSNWANQFKGKKIGVVYGAEEHEYDGKVSMRHLPKWFCSFDKVDQQSIPEPKFLSGAAAAANKPSGPADDSFINVPEGSDEDIPF